MRIAHISDLHLCQQFKKTNINKTKALIKRALEIGTDHLIITGDISDNSNTEDFQILQDILKSFNFYTEKKASVIIGNHDIYGGVQAASDIINFPSRCALTDVNHKIEMFYNHFKELFTNATFLLPGNPFPFIKEIEGVLLLGINSIDSYSRLKNPFASNGKVSKIQRKAIDEFFINTKNKHSKRIAAVHHHFYQDNIPAKSSESFLWNKIENFTMKLRGKKKIVKLMLENKFDCVLHGHSHEMKEYFRKGIRFINAGGSVENESANMANLFVIDVLPYGVDTSIESIEIKKLKRAKYENELVLTAEAV